MYIQIKQGNFTGICLNLDEDIGMIVVVNKLMCLLKFRLKTSIEK